MLVESVVTGRVQSVGTRLLKPVETGLVEQRPQTKPGSSGVLQKKVMVNVELSVVLLLSTRTSVESFVCRAVAGNCFLVCGSHDLPANRRLPASPFLSASVHHCPILPALIGTLPPTTPPLHHSPSVSVTSPPHPPVRLVSMGGCCHGNRGH